MNGHDKPVLIVGGGLGGLGTALALAQAGLRVHVLEQAREISPIGYGIQLGPNVFKVFDRLGVTPAVRAACDYPTALVMPDVVSGEVLMRIPLTTDAYRQRFSAPYVVIHRSTIHDILLDACRRQPGIELTVNATVVDVQDDGTAGVRAVTAEGVQHEGCALIGADGVKSRIRNLIVPDVPARDTGYVAHRTILPMAAAPRDLRHLDEVALWSGPGYHVVHYPLQHGELFNVVAVFRNPAPGVDDPARYEAQVRAIYANVHPALKNVLALMDLEKRWPLTDRDPFRPWHRGRVALLGDAAHPTLQSYAQGAGMALEDAVCLADQVVASGGDFERAFGDYARRRLVRCARIQLGSRELWEFYHAEGIAREARDAALAERTEADSYRCLDWIWNGDASPPTDAMARSRRPASEATQ
jgi:salicylate hydroxylase